MFWIIVINSNISYPLCKDSKLIPPGPRMPYRLSARLLLYRYVRCTVLYEYAASGGMMAVNAIFQSPKAAKDDEKQYLYSTRCISASARFAAVPARSTVGRGRCAVPSRAAAME